MVASLVELRLYLSDVGGNNQEVSMGKANQYVPITKPAQLETKQ